VTAIPAPQRHSRARPLVTVITPTRGRLDALRTAMASVRSQGLGNVEHIVVGDDCPVLASPDVRASLEAAFPTARVSNVPSATPMVTYRPARTARVRNIGIASARGEFIAHLDDDNSYEPDHLATLIATLRDSPAAVAAHSWRRLCDPRGGAYLPAGRNPWIPDPAASARNYAELADSGVFSSGSNVMRDRISGRRGQEFFLVDTSELLVRACFHLSCPFRTEYTTAEMADGLCEDRAWCIDVILAGHSIVRSRRATLRYTMGGYSNSSHGPAACQEAP
jgi:glycosyltransferase involved in cell wall biosynthesis